MPPTKHAPDVPARLPITNERWDAEKMLAKALAGGYPSAKSSRPSRELPWMTEREAEIAYWQGRCGVGDAGDTQIASDLAQRAQQEAALGDERRSMTDEDESRDRDAAFLKRSATQQRSIIHSYLTSNDPGDQARGAHLCHLVGRDAERDRAVAQSELDRRIARSLERLRSTPGHRERGTPSPPQQEQTLWD